MFRKILLTSFVSFLLIGCSSKPKIQIETVYVPKTEYKYVTVDLNSIDGCKNLLTVKQIFKGKPFDQLTEDDLTDAFKYAYTFAVGCTVKMNGIKNIQDEQLRILEKKENENSK